MPEVDSNTPMANNLVWGFGSWNSSSLPNLCLHNLFNFASWSLALSAMTEGVGTRLVTEQANRSLSRCQIKKSKKRRRRRGRPLLLNDLAPSFLLSSLATATATKKKQD
jgi:hypothetical protein